MRKWIAAVLMLVLVLSLTACGTNADRSDRGGFGKNKQVFRDEMFELPKEKAAPAYTFMESDSSKPVKVQKGKLQAFRRMLAETVEYGYPELFNYEQAMAGFVDRPVTEHAYSALDGQGVLTAEHLCEIVMANNAVYLEEHTFGYKALGRADVLRFCRIVTDTINELLMRYPQVDKSRVYCNLGNLKILERTGALDFAAIEADMVFHVNGNTATSAMLLTTGNMYLVTVHETVHIMQYGCVCETVENRVRRCGMANAYSNVEQDHSDWLWVQEAAAERISNLHLNTEPMTYNAMVNYLLTLDLVTMLQENVPANYVEQLCFQGDPEKLFALFGAKTDEEKQEIYHMIYALEIMQREPLDVKEAYERLYGQAWSSDIRDVVNHEIKRPIVKTLTKCFFRNLIETIEKNTLTQNDVLFLLNLYESTINYHLGMDQEQYDDYNREFMAWYSQVQDAFFGCMDDVTKEDYMAYVASDGVSMINATLSWLGAEKKDLLLEKFEDTLCAYKVA